MKPTTKGGADDLETFAMENCLMLLATKAKSKTHHDSSRQPDYDTRCTYACKTCGKKFNSFQALGGHCASHRNNNNKLNVVGESSPVELRPKKHGCSICKVEFPTGQALGGHMRRHRPLVVPVPALTAERSTLTTEVSLENSDGNNKRTKDDEEEEEEVKNSRRKRVCLDLNLSEIEGGETIILKREESDKQDIDDFLKLELRQPIRD